MNDQGNLMPCSVMPLDGRPLILLGAGGHAKVVLSLLRLLNQNILGVCCPELAKTNEKIWRGLPVLGDDSGLEQYSPEKIALVNGIGQLVNNPNRAQRFHFFKSRGFYFPTLVHPSAYVDNNAKLEDGVQIMAGAVIQTDVHIESNTIINTRASVDHDCRVAANVHIAPGAVVCGNVRIGEGAYIGSASVIAQGIKIGEDAVVGAGVSVVREVLPGYCILPAAIRYKRPVKHSIKNTP